MQVALSNVSNVGATEVYHQFARLQSMTQWWHWLALLGLVLVTLVFVVFLYRRDGFEMGRGKRWALVLLRVAAFVGVLVFFFDLEKRSRREVVKNSRAILLVDTSLSMGIQDDAPGTGPSGARRIDAVISELSTGKLLDQLRGEHDVIVYGFGETEEPVELASLPKTASDASVPDSGVDAADVPRDLDALLVVGLGLAAIGLLGCLFYITLGRRNDHAAWSLFVGVVCLIAGGVVMATADLRYPNEALADRWTPGTNTEAEDTPEADTELPGGTDAEVPEPIDWSQKLAPRGAETRLGDAVRRLVLRERDGATAGIVVATDGGNNAGITAEQAAAAAKSAQIPVFTIGLGGADRPANVRVVDVEAPTRVYPGDRFTLNGYLQSFGFAGRTVQVELRSANAADNEETGLYEQEEERTVPLGQEGELVPIRFEVVPREPGVRRYEIRVSAPERDSNQQDNQSSAKVQIVERKNRVLLVAGGPSREYRFLRDLLFRDRNTTLDVFLQSGRPGMSQESDQLLSEFPPTAEELFEYDCIVAFDPDWLSIDATSIELLERWISEEAGGLVLVAGPVHTPRWVSRVRSESKMSIVRAIYPVVFYGRGSATLGLGRFASETPWPLHFEPDGKDAEFLWLGDDAVESEQVWQDFEGIYGYYAVKDPKPGARVYSRFSDPSTGIDGDLPIYHAGHFYGAGRVFFQASGEMWRIRSVEDSLFEQYYTKLIRWVSQGRLLRDSSRGVLLVDKARCVVGDHIVVRAVLSDAQHEPLTAESVTAVVVDPDGRRSSLVMSRLQEAPKGGMYSAQVTASHEGDYRIELQPPHGAEDELLVREVRARIPARETERPERDDVLLKDLADLTGGEYFIGFSPALESANADAPPLASKLQPRDQVSYVAGTPDKTFERVLMTWLMGLVAGVLCLEWLIRRLSRLA